MSNVKLAIRLRPFTDRELKSEKDCTPVVTVIDGNTVTITNIKVSLSGAGDSRERVRRYFADHTFDSAGPATHPEYASQEKVFETIGREVVGSVSRGCSACVLAYGQSATGKTHTMMGSDAQPGLVPRVCRALADQQPFLVTVSFLEIYNERVHDLLVGDAPTTCHSLPRRRGNSRKDLRVREHPSRGPYVQNLRRVAVTDIGTLLSLVEEGARRRRTAATRRNSTSSRSHALLELATSQATLHLADLAGSEKASWEGCGGGRQKEGANINKSLVALSNVISALVSGGIRGRFVPYRDSALTWLLKDCFTGGASTFIIATVSPSAACYGESASTLRWAARARQLPTSRALNCGPSTPSRAALQAQLNQLLEELARNHIRYIHETGKITYDDNHWMLQVDDKSQLYNALNTETNIGNIINMFDPKTEANNSESTASSIASGSSDVINTMDKSIKDEISKEVDKLFGPSLERTRSGGDLEVIAPLRHKRRQYKSQEVLPIDKILQGQNPNMNSSSQSQEKINETEGTDKGKPPPIPIFYDNQRAEIVASVTERLYSKLKKKEEAAVSKMETMMDRKIMEPLSELRICTNARQRLVELSHRAIRNKRRIGIPAHTQTRLTVTRVKDQGIDVQTDLETYVMRKDNSYTFQRDVSTETLPMTPRCKEIAVGPKFGSLYFLDRSTITESKQVALKSSFAMTDVITKYDRCTQTLIAAPPRRKKRASNFAKHIASYESNRESTEASNMAPVISINISQQYPIDTESQSSDENIENEVIKNQPICVTMTPDLLTNHNTVDTSAHDDESDMTSIPEKIEFGLNQNTLPNQHDLVKVTSSESQAEENEEFPESEDLTLPRVTADSSNVVNQEEMKDMILGRNENMYPYNIVLSPPRERENTKKIVKFQEVEMAPSISTVSQTSWKWENNENFAKAKYTDAGTSDNDTCAKDSQTSSHSDSTDSSKVETSFIWNKGGRIHQFGTTSSSRGYTPINKNNSKYRTAKARIYKEFLGLQQNEDADNEHLPQFSSLDIKDLTSSESTDNEKFINRFRDRRQFFENRFKRSNIDSREIVEKKILDACDSLDRSVNKYESYLTNCHGNDRKYFGRGVTSAGRTPTEYLQHLVKLRREVVRADCDTTDSSIGINTSRK